MMDIFEKKQQLIDDLSIIDDSEERFAYVIDMGKEADPLDAQYKTDAFRLDGCVSNLWLLPEFKEGKCWFRADSDSLITKGIAALLCGLYNGQPPEDILKVDPAFLADVGVTQHLSPNRRNGLSSLWSKIKGYAEMQAAGQA